MGFLRSTAADAAVKANQARLSANEASAKAAEAQRQQKVAEERQKLARSRELASNAIALLESYCCTPHLMLRRSVPSPGGVQEAAGSLQFDILQGVITTIYRHKCRSIIHEIERACNLNL